MKYSLFAILLLFSASASCELNKWVDSEGKVHYSDEPPPADVKARTLKAPTAPAASTGRSTAERDAEWKKSQRSKEEAQKKATEEAENAQQMKAHCDAERSNLKLLQEGGRIAILDANGERSYIDDATRQQRIAAAQQEIAKYCR